MTNIHLLAQSGCGKSKSIMASADFFSSEFNMYSERFSTYRGGGRPLRPRLDPPLTRVTGGPGFKTLKPLKKKRA